MRDCPLVKNIKILKIRISTCIEMILTGYLISKSSTF